MMLRVMIRCCAAVAVAAVLFVGGRSARADSAFALPSPDPYSNGSWAFGEVFTVNQAITVTALGAFDANGDGFSTPGGIQAGIFNFTTETLLTSANVLSTDPLTDGFRYHTIAPLTLLPGVVYDDVVVSGSDLYNIDTNFTVAPEINLSGYAYGQSTTLQILKNFTGSERIWMSNFEFGGTAVPEPSSLVLVSIGAIGAGLFGAFRRRRHRAE
jgi:hypothetical protein